jgi:hypothetical protein
MLEHVPWCLTVVEPCYYDLAFRVVYHRPRFLNHVVIVPVIY